MRLPNKDEIKDDLMDASKSTKSVDGRETIIPLEVFSGGERGYYINMKLVVLQKKWFWSSSPSFDIAIAMHVEIWDFRLEKDSDDTRRPMEGKDDREFKDTMNKNKKISAEDRDRWTGTKQS